MCLIDIHCQHGWQLKPAQTKKLIPNNLIASIARHLALLSLMVCCLATKLPVQLLAIQASGAYSPHTFPHQLHPISARASIIVCYRRIKGTFTERDATVTFP